MRNFPIDRIHDRIRHVVYVAAAVPAQGQSVVELLLDGKPLPDVVPPPPEDPARQMFCNDMDDRQTRFVLDNLVPEAGRPFSEPMDRSPWLSSSQRRWARSSDTSTTQTRRSAGRRPYGTSSL